MTKKYEDMSYKEVHKKLEDAMQDVYTSDEAAPSGSPEIDYSFMDSSKEKKDRKQIFKSRFNKVAAIIIMVLLSMNIIMMATGAGVSYSEKGLLHRIYEGARGIFTDEDESEYVELDETGKTYTITSMNQITYAKQIWPDLYIPKYIPEGFILNELNIRADLSNRYYAIYNYNDKESILKIVITTINNNGEISSKKIDEYIKLDNRLIGLYYDSLYEMYVADIYFEDVIITITGNVSKNEIIEIAKNLNN